MAVAPVEAGARVIDGQINGRPLPGLRRVHIPAESRWDVAGNGLVFGRSGGQAAEHRVEVDADPLQPAGGKIERCAPAILSDGPDEFFNGNGVVEHGRRLGGGDRPVAQRGPRASHGGVGSDFQDPDRERIAGLGAPDMNRSRLSRPGRVFSGEPFRVERIRFDRIPWVYREDGFPRGISLISPGRLETADLGPGGRCGENKKNRSDQDDFFRHRGASSIAASVYRADGSRASCRVQKIMLERPRVKNTGNGRAARPCLKAPGHLHFRE